MNYIKILKNSNNLKILFILFFVTVGFMIKLPRIFNSYDKILHFLFYFYSISLISLIYVKNRMMPFLVLVFTMAAFGLVIEIFQEYSNRFFAKRIHGDFDIEDVKYNCMGLMLYSSIWFIGYISEKIKN